MFSALKGSKVALILIIFMTTLTASEEGSCPKCVIIRKANEEKAKTQTWVFYEDWLKTDEGKEHQKEEEIKFEEPVTEVKE